VENGGLDSGVDLAEQRYSKDVNDWVAENGVGVRKYDNLTVIGRVSGDQVNVDWIHEYSKERVHIRNMLARPGMLSRIKLAMDSSQAWIILVCTGTSLSARSDNRCFSWNSRCCD
jgi:hypothetical protein